MNEEILNIQYHVCRLVVKALNSFKSHRAAARALKICDRTLSRYKQQFHIVEKKGVYQALDKPTVIVLRIVEQR